MRYSIGLVVSWTKPLWAEVAPYMTGCLSWVGHCLAVPKGCVSLLSRKLPMRLNEEEGPSRFKMLSKFRSRDKAEAINIKQFQPSTLAEWFSRICVILWSYFFQLFVPSRHTVVSHILASPFRFLSIKPTLYLAILPLILVLI